MSFITIYSSKDNSDLLILLPPSPLMVLLVLQHSFLLFFMSYVCMSRYVYINKSSFHMKEKRCIFLCFLLPLLFIVLIFPMYFNISMFIAYFAFIKWILVHERLYFCSMVFYIHLFQLTKNCIFLTWCMKMWLIILIWSRQNCHIGCM